ncbi:hypothetical protein [Pseudomonas vranovensis]|uniref:hypothetical protein n=1 Tax=Pseudomonas vranovensis TaxID=321661 RepID=UPI003D966A67
MSSITIRLKLNEQQAKQYLQWLDSQYDTTRPRSGTPIVIGMFPAVSVAPSRQLGT